MAIKVKPISETPKAIWDRLYDLKIPMWRYDPELKKDTLRHPTYDELVAYYHFIAVGKTVYCSADEEYRLKAYLDCPYWSVKKATIPDVIVAEVDGKKLVLKNRYGKDQLPRETDIMKAIIPGLNNLG